MLTLSVLRSAHSTHLWSTFPENVVVTPNYARNPFLRAVVFILRFEREEFIMKTWTVAAALVFVGTVGFAQTDQTAASAARKSCDDLKAEISKKLDTKGVVGYSLDAVDKGKEGDGKVVGTCDGGTKSLVYSRTAATQAKAADEKKPQ